MQDGRDGTISDKTPIQPIDVSSNNPCPFLRAIVSEGFVGGHDVPLATLAGTVEAASGKTGFPKFVAGVKTWLVAVIANGLGPCRLLRSTWSGATLDELRNGPLDKHGVGSRILGVNAQVNEGELARFASFGKDRPDPAGGTERGLTASEIVTYMDANFERGKGHRRWYDRKLMKGEWPVLLDVMGKGEGNERYLSVAEVRTLFTERRLPERINARLRVRPTSSGVVRTLAKGAAVLAALVLAFVVVLAEFPGLLRPLPGIGKLVPPALPAPMEVKAAYWLDQNWSTEDRFWFQHASQGTATFPVPYSWYVALEQPVIHLFSRPGMLTDSAYLERFGFIPSPKTVRADANTLRRFGFVNSDAKTEPAPESVAGLKPLPADNLDGLPVGFARMTGVINPATGGAEADKIGLTCAGCHTGSLNYKGTSIRFDGGPAMLELRKLELTTGLSILYTLYVPGRFDRFADRVLGRDADPAERDKLKTELKGVWTFLKSQVDAMDKLADNGQPDTPEGYGRLDALNRIGNQVFYTDFVKSNLQGYERNLHANDAPVSYPPVWTVPWLWWAQYDASIEQPLIRNAGEALGVRASLNLSPDFPADRLFRSSLALENLARIEAMLRGSDPFSRTPRSFGGLTSPKWPSHLFPDDDAWKIDQSRVAKGRTLYGNICAECHLGPVADAAYDEQFKDAKDKKFWIDNPRWTQDRNGGWILNEVTKSAAVMGTDPAQANVLDKRQVQIPDFLRMDPAKELKARWNCDMQSYSSTEMPFSIALMIAVQRTGEKWLSDRGITDPDQIKKIWGDRSNCPNPAAAKEPQYRARPLNGVWATAPYIHNGSVPSLWWVLTPQAERPKQFCMGARDFDPKKVGFDVPASGESSCKSGQTLFSMTDSSGKAIKGNSVLGHSFEAAADADKKTYPNGVIGRKLTDEERYDLIEYLKTL
ncbi:cytochrome C [Bradyrhizobium lablabi]|uniref:di-heme-cytochrome C peroxidase n=1 Tax=Bradyrhizobium lablabi TaxID=722472 RepID=UPI001BA4EF4A|nr:di-heme-cytochrome C peroxidase [Bradyrhizobium lablabi]MBR1121339.1 cytochrome C [Bradyrhizobium lablabi]